MNKYKSEYIEMYQKLSNESKERLSKIRKHIIDRVNVLINDIETSIEDTKISDFSNKDAIIKSFENNMKDAKKLLELLKYDDKCMLLFDSKFKNKINDKYCDLYTETCSYYNKILSLNYACTSFENFGYDLLSIEEVLK